MGLTDSFQKLSSDPDSADVMAEILRHLQDSNRLGYSMVPSIGKFRICVFWHDSGLKKSDALYFVDKLSDIGIDVSIAQHVITKASDAIWIRQSTPKDVVQASLRLLREVPKFIFPHDYPDAECGALSEYSISLGLHSIMRDELRDRFEEPYELDSIDFGKLVDETISQYDLDLLLQTIAPSRRQS